MPLKGGYSEKTFLSNIDTLTDEGKTYRAAKAQAMKMARIAWDHKHKGKPYPMHLVAPIKNKARKKIDKRKVGTSQTKVSRVTKKKPTVRLKKRRASNTKKGYYPNPTKARKITGRIPGEHLITVVDPFLRKIVYYDGAGGFMSERNKSPKFSSKKYASDLARKIRGLKTGQFIAVFPASMTVKEVWEKVDKNLAANLRKQAV